MKRSSARLWIRRFFLVWAVFVMAWLANSVRTRGVDPQLLRSDSKVAVVENAETLTFTPVGRPADVGLVFICGSGVHAHAYVPMLRPIADAGFRVVIVKLPYRFAPLESHKAEAARRVQQVVASGRWVLSGHSLGGALACRVPSDTFVLVGTTHPKSQALAGRVTKIYATNDGVAPVDRVMANKHLLPADTQWVEIRGGNHSQFGHYGHQLMDGRATISREEQQKQTRDAILGVLKSHRAPSGGAWQSRGDAEIAGGLVLRGLRVSA